jgi:hypothetical protein
MKLPVILSAAIWIGAIALWIAAFAPLVMRLLP